MPGLSCSSKGRNVPYQTAISTLPIQKKSKTMMRRHFPFGMCQAFTAMKCRDLGWKNLESSIREVKNITQLNTVLKSFDVRSWSVTPSKPWKVSRTLEVMFELLKAKHEADPRFRSFCDKLGPKVPCEATVNKYWGCGVDMEVLHSLDQRLFKETDGTQHSGMAHQNCPYRMHTF